MAAEQGEIGLMGLGVMGKNLVLNMADRGFSVAVYNRTAEKTGSSSKRRLGLAGSCRGTASRSSWACCADPV